MPKYRYATPFPVLHAASLLNHESRIRKFHAALKLVVTSESYVVDLGTGSGILALLAAKAGARRVTAVDINPECIDYARKAASMNGVDNRVDFFVGHFSEFRPRERADIVVCEMLSSMMLVEQQVPACSYAVKHVLKKGGKILPQSARVWIVPVESSDAWSRFDPLDFHFPRLPQTVGPEDYRDLAAAKQVASFNFSSRSPVLMLDRVVRFDIIEEGMLHGIVGFFESDVLDEITLHMNDGWRELFIPLEQAVSVSRGDTVRLRLQYEMGQFDSAYLMAL